MRCFLRIHNFGKWYQTSAAFQERQCSDCGIRQGLDFVVLRIIVLIIVTVIVLFGER